MGERAEKLTTQVIPTGSIALDLALGVGGLPKGRPTLVCGGAGSGKTMLALEFLIRGATEFNEPGVFIAFEETIEDLTKNVASLGFDLKDLIAKKKLYIDYVRIERSEIEETGDYDLEGLFVRIEHAVNQVGAKRIALDTVESLFSGLSSIAILRAELRRLFGWLKEKGLTAIITGEKGDNTFTRQSLEEYVSDCVILLDHRINDQISTRRIRIVKYRGTVHGTNEYPFLIDEDGISVLPISSLQLDHTVSRKRVSSGLESLDEMLGGKGYYIGSTILVSGTAGTGKTSIAAHFALTACKRGERVLFFTFEESADQVMRNMKTIGIDFEPYVKKGLLHFKSSRPSVFGLEMHLVVMHKLINKFKPNIVILDPMSNLFSVGNPFEINSMLTRLIDFLKSNHITALFTDLRTNKESSEGVTSLADIWIIIRTKIENNEREKRVYVRKARGIAHSMQEKKLLISKKGVEILTPKAL